MALTNCVIPTGLTSFRPGTPRNLVLRAGKVFFNVNKNALALSGLWADAINPANQWTDPFGRLATPRKGGATRGGTRVNLNRPIEDVEVDDMVLQRVGMQVINSARPTIETSFLEIGDWQTLQVALASVNVTKFPAGGPYTYRRIKPRTFVNACEDFLANVAIFASVAGSADPQIIIYDNVLCKQDPQFNYVANNQLAVPVVLTAHALEDDADDELPVEFWEPIQPGNDYGS